MFSHHMKAVTIYSIIISSVYGSAESQVSSYLQPILKEPAPPPSKDKIEFVTGIQGVSIQSSGTQSSGTQSSGTQSSGTQSSGTQSSGTQSSGTQSSGTHPSSSNDHPGCGQGDFEGCLGNPFGPHDEGSALHSGSSLSDVKLSFKDQYAHTLDSGLHGASLPYGRHVVFKRGPELVPHNEIQASDLGPGLPHAPVETATSNTSPTNQPSVAEKSASPPKQTAEAQAFITPSQASIKPLQSQSASNPEPSHQDSPSSSPSTNPFANFSTVLSEAAHVEVPATGFGPGLPKPTDDPPISINTPTSRPSIDGKSSNQETKAIEINAFNTASSNPIEPIQTPSPNQFEPSHQESPSFSPSTNPFADPETTTDPFALVAHDEVHASDLGPGLPKPTDDSFPNTESTKPIEPIQTQSPNQFEPSHQDSPSSSPSTSPFSNSGTVLKLLIGGVKEKAHDEVPASGFGLDLPKPTDDSFPNTESSKPIEPIQTQSPNQFEPSHQESPSPSSSAKPLIDSGIVNIFDSLRQLVSHDEQTTPGNPAKQSTTENLSDQNTAETSASEYLPGTSSRQNSPKGLVDENDNTPTAKNLVISPVIAAPLSETDDFPSNIQSNDVFTASYNTKTSPGSAKASDIVREGFSILGPSQKADDAPAIAPLANLPSIAVVLEGQILPSGPPSTGSGTRIAHVPSALEIIIGTKTSELVKLSPTLGLDSTMALHGFDNPDKLDNIITVEGQSLSLEGLATRVSGTPVHLVYEASQVSIGSNSTPLSSLLAITDRSSFTTAGAEPSSVSDSASSVPRQGTKIVSGSSVSLGRGATSLSTKTLTQTSDSRITSALRTQPTTSFEPASSSPSVAGVTSSRSTHSGSNETKSPRTLHI